MKAEPSRLILRKLTENLVFLINTSSQDKARIICVYLARWTMDMQFLQSSAYVFEVRIKLIGLNRQANKHKFSLITIQSP